VFTSSRYSLYTTRPIEFDSDGTYLVFNGGTGFTNYFGVVELSGATVEERFYFMTDLASSVIPFAMIKHTGFHASYLALDSHGTDTGRSDLYLGTYNVGTLADGDVIAELKVNVSDWDNYISPEGLEFKVAGVSSGNPYIKLCVSHHLQVGGNLYIQNVISNFGNHITFNHPVQLPVYTSATLPSTGEDGEMAIYIRSDNYRYIIWWDDSHNEWRRPTYTTDV